jgi:hypothetical protein
MKRIASLALSLVVVALGTAAVVLPTLASAEGPQNAPQAQAKVRPEGKARPPADRERPSAVAIAFGAVAGDEHAYIDFHAATGSDRQAGNLRFWTEDDGYYNGAVRVLTINGQNVHAEGAGPLWKTDGTRVPVRFTLDLNGGSNRLRISVQGRDLEYTLEGRIEGFVFIGAPPQN